MLTYEDCVDYCDLTEDEVEALRDATHIPPIEVVAMVQQYADSPRECRIMLKFLLEYLEKVEQSADSKRSHELHDAISHFAARHHYI